MNFFAFIFLGAAACVPPALIIFGKRTKNDRQLSIIRLIGAVLFLVLEILFFYVGFLIGF
ncbi:MAG: hypothetical protein OEZ02_03710 [Anaerolineae bacterium]|nr:hypothetical protein [Anaerolineae bacterium]